MARLLDVVLSEDQVGARGHRLGVAREAHLGAMLGGQRVAVVLQLLVGAALALALARAGHAVLRHQRLQAELNRDRHQLRALCYRARCLHSLAERVLLLLLQDYASCLLDPDHLRLGLFVDLDECSADDLKLVLEGVCQVARNVLVIVEKHLVCRVKDRIEVFNKGQDQARVPIVLLFALELGAWDHSLNDVLRELIEVGADAE